MQSGQGFILSPDILLGAYARGIFPMAESREAPELFWLSPEWRGTFPICGFHISRSLKKRLLSSQFSYTIDADFSAVVQLCADREETWINDELFRLYDQLHAQGAAHSVEIWENGAIVGGVFGLRIGAAFFGESMFSRATDASKAALAVLHAHLQAGGFTLFDTQFLTPHLKSLGAIEIARDSYLSQLAQAIKTAAHFPHQQRKRRPTAALFTSS